VQTKTFWRPRPSVSARLGFFASAVARFGQLASASATATVARFGDGPRGRNLIRVVFNITKHVAGEVQEKQNVGYDFSYTRTIHDLTDACPRPQLNVSMRRVRVCPRTLKKLRSVRVRTSLMYSKLSVSAYHFYRAACNADVV